MKRLTIFTPTYNRAYCLPRLYESLSKQTVQAFIWLIIDDGSTDDTASLVQGWMDDGKVDIRYIKQSNQGMHGAHNTAYARIHTELNMCIDSDDYVPVDAVEKIIHFWERHGSNEVSGLVGLDADTDGRIIGTELPSRLERSTLFDLYAQHNVTGDKKLVYRTELTRRFPYPRFENENYVGLAYKYYRLDTEYELLLLNEVLCYVEYMADGSSNNMLHQYRRNPRGFSFYRTELMKLPFGSKWFKLRQAIHYVSSSIIGRNRHFLQQTPQKGLTLLALPFGFLLYLYVMMKTRPA